MRPLGIEGAWVLEPKVFPDDRGSFHEWYRGEEFRGATGYDLGLTQGNCSVSRRGVLRGVHFADVPPGQAKYVTCVRGAVLDVVVDVRVGSPGFGRWEAVRLDDDTRHAVFLAEGLGHAFLALADGSVTTYLCSREYAPATEHGVSPLDPALGLPWSRWCAVGDLVLSDKDAAAPTLAQARDAGTLPTWDACLARREQLLAGSARP